MNFERVGLVLSGGGTKGIAHAGVLKFLQEKDIEVDILSCCSAGSIVGCLHAIGKTPEEILEFSILCIFSTGNTLHSTSRGLFLR
ncbi:patatin-like phospholipase family protein [Chryseobacterium sp. CH21]|uniref:patatin-like phospholipase family protein n=1 Tax=Chryseobacterium sp. CH21 TaxID=713556 RepID=UPI001E4DE56D|nr:patatin-like phospholipase family protein [Chryseobacterium sp. CH21]